MSIAAETGLGSPKKKPPSVKKMAFGGAQMSLATITPAEQLRMSAQIHLDSSRHTAVLPSKTPRQHLRFRKAIRTRSAVS